MEIYNEHGKQNVEKLVADINKLYGGEFITAEYTMTAYSKRSPIFGQRISNGWFFVYAGRTHHEGCTEDAIKWLQQLKNGVKKYGK